MSATLTRHMTHDRRHNNNPAGWGTLQVEKSMAAFDLQRVSWTAWHRADRPWRTLTSMMKSVKGLRLSGPSSPLRSCFLCLTRNWASVFSSLETFSRRSIFSTSSGELKRAARRVMGLGESSLALWKTRLISSMLPSGGKPEEEQKDFGSITLASEKRSTFTLFTYNSSTYTSILLKED